MSEEQRPLSVALLSYRSRPHCGGQGVYIRHLSRELAARGHDVEVISGPPYPELDEVVRLTKLDSLDLYKDAKFRMVPPAPSNFKTSIDVLEFGMYCMSAFPEPLTFSLRAYRELKNRPAAEQPDIIHDNQTLGYGMLLMQRKGMPIIANIHHPITVDRRLELDVAKNAYRRYTLRRWYSFLKMQGRVARRMTSMTTVSRSSEDDIIRDFGVDRDVIRVIGVGVEHEVFVPPTKPRIPNRIVATASADVALKGVVPLLEAFAKVRTEIDAELVIVGKAREKGPAAQAVSRLGLEDHIRWVSGVSEEEIVDIFNTATLAVVPSLYEGFSLPAIEVMSCATPLVATTAGALPEVVGPDGETALHVPPGDPDALAAAILRVLKDPDLAARLGAAGRARVIDRFTWSAVAQKTEAWYYDYLSNHDYLSKER